MRTTTTACRARLQTHTHKSVQNTGPATKSTMCESAAPAIDFAHRAHLSQCFQCDSRSPKCHAYHAKCNHAPEAHAQSIAPATQSPLGHPFTVRFGVTSLSSSIVQQRSPPKAPLNVLSMTSHERLRTVAHGFERLRTQTQRRANTPPSA